MRTFCQHSFPGFRRLAVAALAGTAGFQFTLLSIEESGDLSASLPEARVDIGDEGFNVMAGGQTLAEYRFATDRGPVFYPVFAPGGQRVTRGFPIEEIEGESRDHPHHRSLWISYGNANGHDFWHGGSATIQHRDVELLEKEAGGAAVRVRNDWIANGGETICTDERVYRFATRGEDIWLLDIDLAVVASHGDLTLFDDKEGFLAVRVAPSMRVRGGEGSILNSEGHRDREAWAKRAKWCSYFGPVDGETVGVTIFDHPENLRHPSWWHVRDYGLFAVNPFGMHTFEGAPEGSGDVAVPGGELIRFRYRVAFHKGSPEEIDVEELFQDFIAREHRINTGKSK